MKAMVLAAGFGTRLQPLTHSMPKPLIEVAGQPMIYFALKMLRAAGISEVVINLHHFGEQIRSHLGNGSKLGLHLHYSEEDPILDTGGGIAAARAFLSDDSFVVANADTFLDLDLREVLAFHAQRQATATMVVRPDPKAERRDDVCLDAHGRIHRFLGHGEPMHAELQRCMYAGVAVFTKQIFSHFGKGAFSLTRDTCPRLLAAGEPMFGFVHSGYWRVLDTHADLAAGRSEIPHLLRHG